MSTKDWKDKELNGLLNERWGFSMNLDKLNEGSCGSHKRDDEEPLEEEEKKKMVKDPKTGKMVPDYAIDGEGKNDLKEEEEINEISMGHGTDGVGSKVNLDNARKNIKNVGNPPKKDEKKKPTNEEKEDFGPKTDMTKLSDEEKEKFLNAITAEELKAALKKKENKDPKEAKLREAIRRVIRKQLRK